MVASKIVDEIIKMLDRAQEPESILEENARLKEELRKLRAEIKQLK